MSFAFAAIAVVIAFLYVGIPLLLMMRRITGCIPAAPVAPENVPPQVDGFFRQVAPLVQSIGFEYAGCYAALGGDTSQPYIAMWINRRLGQRAQAVAVYWSGGTLVNAEPFVKFSTTFADGTQIQTSSTDGFEVNPWPDLDFLHAAIAKDPLTLYQLHRWREDAIAPRDKPRFLLPPGEEFRYFNPTPEETEFGMRRQLSTGRFRRTADGANVPTLLGAFSIVWPMLPPMSFIYRAAERRRARAQLDAAMAQPPAPLVDVNITTESPYRL